MSSLLFYTKTNSTPRKILLSGIFTIGSEANADIRLKLRSECREPVYCLIDATENSVIVENKAKRNPILINGVKMKKTALKDGDKLEIAGIIFQFEAEKQARSSRLMSPLVRRQTLHTNFTSKVTRIPLLHKLNKRVLLRKSLNLSTMKRSRYSKRSSLGANKQSPRSSTTVDSAVTPPNIGTLSTKANTTGRISNERRSIKTPKKDSLRISLFKNNLENKTNISKESSSVLDTIDLLSSSSDLNSFMIELDSPAAAAKQRRSSCTRPTPKKQCCLNDSVASNLNIPTITESSTESERNNSLTPNNTPVKITRKSSSNFDLMKKDNPQIGSPVKRRTTNQKFLNISDIEEYATEDCVRKGTPRSAKKQTPNPRSSSSNYEKGNPQSVSPVKRRTQSLRLTKTPKSVTPYKTTKTPTSIKKFQKNDSFQSIESEFWSPVTESRRSSLRFNVSDLITDKINNTENVDDGLKITPKNNLSKTPTPAKAKRNTSFKDINPSSPLKTMKTPKIGIDATTKTSKLFKKSLIQNTSKNPDYSEILSPIEEGQRSSIDINNRTFDDLNKSHESELNDSNIKITPRQSMRLSKLEPIKVGKTPKRDASFKVSKTPKAETSVQIIKTPTSANRTKTPKSEISTRKSKTPKTETSVQIIKTSASANRTKTPKSEISTRKSRPSMKTELLQDNIFNSTISSDSEDDGELFQSSQKFDDDELNSSKGIENSFNVHNITSVMNNITINIQNGTVPFDNDSLQEQSSSNNITQQPNPTLEKCEYKNPPLVNIPSIKAMCATPKHQKSPLNNLRNVAGVKGLLRTPNLRKIQGIKKMFATPKPQNSPKNDLTDVKGIKKMFATPKETKSPRNDLTRVSGVKKIFATPKEQKSPKNDLTRVSGVKKMFATPKEQKSPNNDLTCVSGVKKMFATPKEQKSPNNDLTRVSGVKKIFATPKEQKSPKNDLTRVSGVKEMFATPKEQKSPNNDLTRVSGVKNMFATPKEQKSPNNDLTRVSGVKKMFATPKQQHSPLNDLRNVVNIKSLMKTPRPPPKSPKNDLTDIKGVKQMMRTPRVQKSPRNDLTQIVNIKELMQTPVQNVSINNVEEFTEDGKKSALFDLTNVKNSSQENVVDKLFKESQRISRKLEKENLEEPTVLTEKVNLKDSPEKQKKTRSRKGVSNKNQADNGKSNNLNESAVNIEIDILDPTLIIKKTVRSRNNVEKSNSMHLIEENASLNMQITGGGKILKEEKKKETAPLKTTRSKRGQKNDEIKSKDAQKDSLSKRRGRKGNNNTNSNAIDDADAATKSHASNDKESNLGNSKKSNNSELAIENKSPAKRTRRRKIMDDNEEPQKDLLSAQPTSLRRKRNDEEGNDVPSSNPTRVKPNTRKIKADDTEEAEENTQRSSRIKKTGGEADVNAKPTAVKRNARKNRNDETKQIVQTEKTPRAKRTTRKRKGETEEPEQDDIVDKTKKTTNQNSRTVDEHENETKSVGKRRKLYKKTDLEQLEEPKEEEPEKRSLRPRRQRT